MVLRATIPPPKTISGARKMKTHDVGPQKCRAHVAINFPFPRRLRHRRYRRVLGTRLACSLFSSNILSLLLLLLLALGSAGPRCFRSVPSIRRHRPSFSSPTILLRLISPPLMRENERSQVGGRAKGPKGAREKEEGRQTEQENKMERERKR